MTVNIAVMGSDRRFARLSELLRAKGCAVVSDAERADLIVTSYPPPEGVPAGIKLATCGPRAAPEGCIDLLSDEEYLVDVAYMTAEGAIAAAAAASDFAICGVSCLIVGWGRIGKALAELMLCLNAHVTVLTRRQGAHRQIEQLGAHAANTDDAAREIVGKQIIFSTPPSMVLDHDVVRHAEPQALIIDLASPPYGVDIDAARACGVKAWREPGLPGRYCPENAARAIYDALVRGGALDGET
jgi:dipicolinate synthase subunit A